MSAIPALATWAVMLASASTAAADAAATDNSTAARMAVAREEMVQESRPQFTTTVLDRFEYQAGHGHIELNWRGELSTGGDRNRFVLSSQGESAVRGSLTQSGAEGTDFRAIWRHALNPWFDSQIGVRHDLRPQPQRTYFVAGIRGMAPYWIETEVHAFVSDHGESSIRLEAETDLRLTQRIVLRPTAEVNFALQSVPELGIASGLSESLLGFRARYEISPGFAPYFGTEWRHYGRPGATANSTLVERDAANVLFGFRVRY
jgi:copper resistance protein B